MRVLYIEGVAIHGGPESCVGVREDGGEALTGVVQAGLLSREINVLGCRRCRSKRKATSSPALSRVGGGPCAVTGTWACTEFFMRENREVPGSPASGAGVGLRRAVGATLRR
jgi:hypothetical protein